MEWEPIVTFIVPGRPKAKERPRFNRKTGNVYTPKETKDAERAVIDAFEHVAPLWEPTLEDVRLTLDICFEGKQNQDGDNCFKLVGDALNGYAWRDDKQIKKGSFDVFEHAGDRAGVVVTFYIHKGERP